MKNKTVTKNLPGTYKLVVTYWDGRGCYDTCVTKPLTITRPIVDETLIRKFVAAGLYNRCGYGNICQIQRVK